MTKCADSKRPSVHDSQKGVWVSHQPTRPSPQPASPQPAYPSPQPTQLPTSTKLHGPRHNLTSEVAGKVQDEWSRTEGLLKWEGALPDRTSQRRVRGSWTAPGVDIRSRTGSPPLPWPMELPEGGITSGRAFLHKIQLTGRGHGTT